MNYLVFARVLAIATLYVESGDESIRDPDFAAQVLEDLATVLQDLNPEEIAALDEAIRQVALEYDGKEREAISTIMRDYGLVDYSGDDD